MAPEHVTDKRGLIVLADGVQTAFAAGCIAELYRRGARWQYAITAGLGAQLGVMALLDDAVEGENRWLRQGANGCPLFFSQLAEVRQRLGERPGITIMSEGSSIAGWFDETALVEHLAPEMAAIPVRLNNRGRNCFVAAEDLVTGTRQWVSLEKATPEQAAITIETAARFPAGWGARNGAADTGEQKMWGGVGAMPDGLPPLTDEIANWDLVCGFPYPKVTRLALGNSIWELMQRRAEIASVQRIASLISSLKEKTICTFAPTENNYRVFSERGAEAELGIEYPLPWEKNGELVSLLVGFGAWSAAQAQTSNQHNCC